LDEGPWRDGARSEIPWRLDEDGTWTPSEAFMVCGDGLRVLVEPLD
jgi:hypothetical protein